MRTLLIVLGCASTLLAQAGDRGEKDQPEVWKTMTVPPAPPVPADKALATFKIAPGFRLELAASEPMVVDPVAIAWDEDGRMFAVEMRGYMPNVDGKGEDARNGQIVVLEDRDGDGKYDKSTVFLDGLQMPRAIAVTHGGVLVAEPPVLWFCRDTNGDLKCDEKIEVFRGYGSQGPVEHTDNGLVRNLDNWLYNAKSAKRLKLVLEAAKPKMILEENVGRGQWGITQDNFGRLYHNSNSSYLHADLTPAEYLRRNPHFPIKTGVGKSIASDQNVWSIRVNPGVNRGYQKATLRPDGRLSRTTATCGPGIYRGDQFPKEYVGHAFVPEPSGNVVSLFAMEETDGNLKTKHLTYDDPQWKTREFLASTDERFRPVNCYTGPDGCMYIVDLYRGILQHKVFVTTFLRKQILERELDKPVGMGRVYRVVHVGEEQAATSKSAVDSPSPQPSPGGRGGQKQGAMPRMSKASGAELVKLLAHPNGWWRDTAQRLLVERGDKAVAPALRDVAALGENELARLHALWTLEGLDALDYETLAAAIEAQDVKLRVHALRLGERLLKGKPKDPREEPAQQELVSAVLACAADKSAEVQRQLVFTLGGAAAPGVSDALRKIATQSAGKVEVREAIITGLHQRELEFLQRLLADEAWSKEDAGKAQFIRELAGCVVTEYKPDRIARLLDLASSAASGAAPSGAAKSAPSTAWHAAAILDGINATAAPKGGRALKPIYYDTQPKSLAALAACDLKPIKDRMATATSFLKFGAPPPPAKPATPLTEDEQKLFAQGKVLYAQTCGVCHQLTGLGEEGKAPPLLDSPFLLGKPDRIVRIVMHGVTGKITVHGRTYDMEMPPLKGFTDEQIAAILTYARREWEHTGDPIDAATVKRIREETKNREAAWTEKELLQIK